MKKLSDRDLATLLPLAEEGDAPSQFKIGWMHYKGWVVKQDVHEAVRWLRRAADQGYFTAQHTLGALYYNGFSPRRSGVKVAHIKPNLVEAYKWLSITSSTGHTYEDGWEEKMIARMTQDELAEAKKLLHDWRAAPDPAKIIR